MIIRRQNNTFQFEEDLFSKMVHGIGEVHHEVLLSMKILQTKPQVNNMNNKNYDLYHTVIKTRNEIETKNDEYENDYIKYNDFITTNHYIGRKNDNVLLWWRKMRYQFFLYKR